MSPSVEMLNSMPPDLRQDLEEMFRDEPRTKRYFMDGMWLTLAVAMGAGLDTSGLHP